MQIIFLVRPSADSFGLKTVIWREILGLQFSTTSPECTLKKILKDVTRDRRNFKIAVERIDFAGSSLAEGELVDAVGKIVGRIVDHNGQMSVTSGKRNGPASRHVEVSRHFPDLHRSMIPREWRCEEKGKRIGRMGTYRNNNPERQGAWII